LPDKVLVAMNGLLRSKIWSKTRLVYEINKFAHGIWYKVLDNLISRGYFFPEEWFIPYLKVDKDETFIDVGAYVGFYTTRMARIAEHVFAFEPNPEAYRILRTRTRTLPNVTCFPYALGSKEKQVKLYLFDFTAGSSIKHKSSRYVFSRCFALDDLIKKSVINAERVGLIKIDVEGAEYEVLLGARAFLKSFHPKMLLEIHSKNNLKSCTLLLKELKYETHMVNNSSSRGIWWLVAHI